MNVIYAVPISPLRTYDWVFMKDMSLGEKRLMKKDSVPPTHTFIYSDAATGSKGGSTRMFKPTHWWTGTATGTKAGQ